MARANLKIATLAALVVGFAGAASATTDFTVQATTPVGSWLDIGSYFTPGTTYNFTVINPATIWSAGSDIPYSRDSTANGIDPVASGYGQWTMLGATFNYGALVGENNGTFFLIGTGTSISGLSGEVEVGYWDSYYGDNSGIQTLAVSVAEPATWAMMLAGFAGLGAVLRTRRRTAATA
jgi:hypothetical protein